MVVFFKTDENLNRVTLFVARLQEDRTGRGRLVFFFTALHDPFRGSSAGVSCGMEKRTVASSGAFETKNDLRKT